MEKEEFKRRLKEDPQFKKKVNKLMAIIACLFLFTIVVYQCKKEPEKTWLDMNYEERELFLTTKIKERKIENANDLQIEFESLIKKEFRDPSSVSFDLEPSVYNGLATVVEADSACIHIDFKGYAKNLFNANVPFSGMATLQYDNKSNSVSIKTWSMSE